MPRRRSLRLNQPAFPKFPPEIWLLIVEHFDNSVVPTRDEEVTMKTYKENVQALWNLSETCTFLWDLCTPTLYSIATNLIGGPQQYRQAQLVRSLCQNPELRQYFRSCYSLLSYEPRPGRFEMDVDEPRLDALSGAILILCGNIDYVRLNCKRPPPRPYDEQFRSNGWLSITTGFVFDDEEDGKHEDEPLCQELEDDDEEFKDICYLKALQPFDRVMRGKGIKSDDYQPRSLLPVDHMPPLSATHLQLHEIDDFGTFALRQVLDVFPNLTKLEMNWRLDMAGDIGLSLNYDEVAQVVRDTCPELQELVLRHRPWGKSYELTERVTDHRVYDELFNLGLQPYQWPRLVILKKLTHLKKLTIGYMVFNYWAKAKSLADVLPKSLEHLVFVATAWDPLCEDKVSNDEPSDGDADFIAQHVLRLIMSPHLEQLSTIDLEFLANLRLDVTQQGWEVLPAKAPLKYDWIYTDADESHYWETWCLRLQRRK